MSKQRSAPSGLLLILLGYFLWGFQPLYWQIDKTFDFMFLMAARSISAVVFCLGIVAVQGHLGQLRDVFCDRRVLLREIPASILLYADWIVYIWAVQNGQVLECSFGYYVQPLVVFAFGALIFREKCSPFHFIALAFMIGGIAVSSIGLGRLPWVSVSLAFFFSIYAAIKKSLTIDPIVSTTSEIMILSPLMLLYILLFRTGAGGLAEMNFPRFLFLLGAGVVTAAPMLLYSLGIKKLRLMTVSVLQYISPSLSVICSIILHEEITLPKLVSLGLIWVGITVYIVGTLRKNKKTA